MGILRKVVLDSSIGKISLAQENAVSTLTNEIRDARLRLSHFVHVNNNQILELATRIDIDTLIGKYQHYRDLTTMFNFAMVPIQDILSVKFYMKNGNDVYLKDDVMLPRQDIVSDIWYQNALKNKNSIFVGGYTSRVTFAVSRKNQFTIAAGFSPDYSTDRSEKIEMAALFIVSNIGTMLSSYNRQQDMGDMFLYDERGKLLLNTKEGDMSIPSDFLPEKNKITYKTRQGLRYTIISMREPETGWYIVSAVNSAVLFRPFIPIALGIVSITFLLLILFYVFSRYFLRNIINPVDKMVFGLHNVREGNLNIHIEECGQSELRMMIRSFNSMTERLKTVIKEKDEEQHKKYKAELRALQSQINPHFLVNTLNSIRFMAQVASFDGIKNMAEALIKILSTSFRSNEGFYTVREELDVLRSYVFLMKIRYSEGFDVLYHICPQCLECKVPRLILQPIIENSIVHGFSDMEKPGLIQLTISLTDNRQLCFEIEDNGKGMSSEQINMFYTSISAEKNKYTGIGMSNVNSRLKLNYGEEYGLKISSVQGGGTKTMLSIPTVTVNDAIYV